MRLIFHEVINVVVFVCVLVKPVADVKVNKMFTIINFSKIDKIATGSFYKTLKLCKTIILFSQMSPKL